MPRGKWSNHKGKHRRFTNPEELEEQRKREEKERQWRKERGESSTEDEDEDKETGGAKAAGDKPTSSGSSESESEEDEDGKAKGVENLIEISNPNRVQKKSMKLATLNETLTTGGEASKPDLSRKEREELEKQAAQARYQKLHAEGRTEEARADLARLAIIKQQREEAAKKRESEKLQKEAELKSKAAARQKAMGKKT